MTGKAEKRRPLAVAITSLALIGAALVAPAFMMMEGAPLPGSAVQADSRETIPITAPLEIFAAPRVVVERGNVGVVGENAGGSSVGRVFRALVLGGGSDLMLGGAHIVVDQDLTRTTSASLLSEPLAPLVEALAHFKFRSLAIVDTTVVVKAASGDEVGFEITDAEIVTDRNGVLKARGRMAYKGEPLTFDVAFSDIPPAGSIAKDASIQIRANINGKLVQTSFDGRLTLGERGRINADHAVLSMPNTRKTAEWLGIEWPDGRGLGPFSAKGALTIRPGLVSFEQAEFLLDGNSATGALAVKAGAERPSIEGTFAFATFDLMPYLSTETSALARASEWAWGLKIPGFAERSFIRSTDADIRISASNVVKGSSRLGRFAASVSVKGGKLYGELAELEIEQGGKGEGQFTVDMSGSEPRYTVRAALQDIDLATIAAGRIVPAVVEGSGDLQVNITGRGDREADILETLSGTLALDMGEGARIGFDIDALDEAAAAVPPIGWGSAGMRMTSVDTLTARFSASNGVLTTDSVEAKTGDRLFSMIGTVDVDSSAVDLVVSLGRVEAAADMKSATAVGAYRIHGKWQSPAISPVAPSKDARRAVSGANPG